MSLRTEAIDRLWFGQDPFTHFPKGLYGVDQQGWNNDHPLLLQAIAKVRPAVVVEVGVWKGRSVLTIGRTMRTLGLHGVIIAVDTWLGSSDHWFDPANHRNLRFEAGYPKLYHCFMENMVTEGLADLVVPLPLDSVNAAVVLKGRGFTIDLMHIDGAHDYRSVKGDLAAWWPLIRPGGGIVMDDYVADGSAWDGLKRAVDEFVAAERPAVFEATFPKCFLQKALDAS